ncbi:hypothetical protein BGZ76_006104, partial [Entomortierella beljakovae]
NTGLGFLCECGGMFKPARSFTRHFKEYKDISERINEAVDKREDVATESYTIKLHAERQEKIHEDTATINTSLLKDIVAQLKSNSKEERDRGLKLEAQFNHHNDIVHAILERQYETTKEMERLKKENEEVVEIVKGLGSSVTRLEKRVCAGPEPQWRKKNAVNPPPHLPPGKGQDIRRLLSAEPISSATNDWIKVEKGEA